MFRDNCRLIYEWWIAFSAEPLADNNNFEQSLIAAMDIVQGLMKGNRVRRLLLRFAYMNLAKTIRHCKSVAATDRVQGNACRSVGIRDATVIALYLTFALFTLHPGRRVSVLFMENARRQRQWQ